MWNYLKIIRGGIQINYYYLIIINDINNLSSKADILKRIFAKYHSRQIIKKVTDITTKSGLNLEDPQQLLSFKDIRVFRQKAKAKGARLRRYNELTKIRISFKVERSFFIKRNKELSPA